MSRCCRKIDPAVCCQSETRAPPETFQGIDVHQGHRDHLRGRGFETRDGKRRNGQRKRADSCRLVPRDRARPASRGPNMGGGLWPSTSGAEMAVSEWRPNDTRQPEMDPVRRVHACSFGGDVWFWSRRRRTEMTDAL